MSCEDYPRVKVGPENPLRVEKGTPAKLTCNVDSKPAVSSVKWTRNGRFSETSFTYTIPQVSIQVCLLRKNINMYSTDIHTYVLLLLQNGNFSRYYCYYCYCCSDYHCLLLIQSKMENDMFSNVQILLSLFLVQCNQMTSFIVTWLRFWFFEAKMSC